MAEKRLDTEKWLKLSYAWNRLAVPVLTVLLSLVCLYFAFYFTLSDMAVSGSVIDRAAATDKNEIVFASSPMQDEYFVILNGEDNLRIGDKRISCDMLMIPKADKTYSNNYVSFTGTLGQGECALSANLLTSYGLKIGDTVTLRSTGESVKIVSKLPSVAGFDDKYMNEGVAVIGYNEQALASSERVYLSFVKDGDGYTGLDRLISVKKLSDSASRSLLTSFAILISISALVVFVWESLISRKFLYRDLAILSACGMRAWSMYFVVLRCLAVRYFLPAAAVSLGYYLFRFSAYGMSVGKPILAYLGVYLVFNALYAIFIYKRVAICRMKKG